MKAKTDLLAFAQPSERQAKAFTLVELVTIVAIVVLLTLVGASALSGARDRTRIAQCAANLRQFTLAIEIYGNENRGLLPTAYTGSWPWDLPWGLADVVARYGAQRNNLYCPANPPENVDALWNYALNQYRVIGYVMTFPGIPSLNATNLNPSLTPQSILSGPVLMRPPLPASRVLLADATISAPGQNSEANRAYYNYVSVSGGFGTPFRTAHLDGVLPAGGNLGMLDGHVEWRQFPDMHVRTVSGSTPVWWW